MKLTQIAVLAALAFVSSPSMAQSRVLELGHEASPAMIRMPSNDTGELTLQRCARCQVIHLRASGGTRYLIGRDQVTRLQMIKYFDQHPSISVTVMQLKDSQELTRIVVAPALGQ